MSRIRFIPIVVTFFISLIVLFGGWIVYRDYGLVRPLQQELTGSQQVAAVTVNVSGSDKQIDVTLKQVPDLQTAYHSIQKTITDAFHSEMRVNIHDNRSTDLEKRYQSYQPIIYSGIDRGDYVAMIDTIQKRAQQDGISKAVVTMDSENLYIQLEKDDHYLYEVVAYRIKPSVSTQEVKTI